MRKAVAVLCAVLMLVVSMGCGDSKKVGLDRLHADHQSAPQLFNFMQLDNFRQLFSGGGDVINGQKCTGRKNQQESYKAQDDSFFHLESGLLVINIFILRNVDLRLFCHDENRFIILRACFNEPQDPEIIKHLFLHDSTRKVFALLSVMTFLKNRIWQI